MKRKKLARASVHADGLFRPINQWVCMNIAGSDRRSFGAWFFAQRRQFGRSNRVSQFEQFVDLICESRAHICRGHQFLVESVML
jgi:hypothetical protein